MNEGTLAVFTAAAGMVGALGGALTGGIAAVRGARIGAETAAEAVQRQVQDQAAAEYASWLRELRREKYSALVRTASEFAAQIIPLISFESRRNDPDSELNLKRISYFNQLYEARFLADIRMQAAIDDALDVAEDMGHEPYDSHKEQQQFRHELIDRAFTCARSLEREARAELGLPDRHER